MAKPYRMLRITRLVLLGLAYLSGASNLVFAGLIPLIMGGEPLPVFLDGPTVPMRVVGLLNIVVTAPLLFVAFYVPSGMIQVLLEVRDRLPSHAP